MLTYNKLSTKKAKTCQQHVKHRDPLCENFLMPDISRFVPIYFAKTKRVR